MTNTTSNYPTIVTDYSFAQLATAAWKGDPDGNLIWRDLELGHSSRDILEGHQIRPGERGPQGSLHIASEATFAFLFVLTGKVMMQAGDQEAIALETLDCVIRHGEGVSTVFKLSDGAEVITIRSSPEKAGVVGAGTGSWMVNRDAEDNYILGDGPRSYFKYRDLGIAAATQRRIHIHIVRAIQAVDGGTGWHEHSMGQLFFVLRGWADLEVERQSPEHMTAGDAMCIAPWMKHVVPAFSADYLVLEMCIPADYDTIDTEAA